ncbi:MAG: TonB family protein [Alcanivoracaceae bacterium]
MSLTRKALALVLAVALHLPLFLHEPAGLQQGEAPEGRATQTGVTLKLAGKPPAPARAAGAPAPPPVARPVAPTPRPARTVSAPAAPSTPRELTAARESTATEDEEAGASEAREGGQVMGLGGASRDGQQDDDIERYLGVIRSRVQRLIEYPQQARLRRQQGTVTIAFSIDSDGRARNIEVVSSSGSALLDQAAVRLFERLRLPPPGPELLPLLQRRSIPVVYELR